MSIERAALVIANSGYEHVSWAKVVAEALAAEGLLVTDEQQRLIRLGEAVEQMLRAEGQYGLLGFSDRRKGWNDCLDAIHAAGGEQ